MTKTCPVCKLTFNGPEAKKRLAQHRSSHTGTPVATPAVHSQKKRTTTHAVEVTKAERDLYRRSRTRGPAVYSGPPPDKGTIDYKKMLVHDIGSTPEGRAWALAALHPCGEGEIDSGDIGNLAGMPDTMTGSVVTPNYRSESVIAFSGALFPTPPTVESGTWDVEIVIPPIPEIDYIYRLIFHPATGSTATSLWNVIRTPNMNLAGENRAPTMGSMGYGKSRIIGLGHTFVLESNSTNNQGRIVAGQMEGQWTEFLLRSLTSNFTTDPTNQSVIAQDGTFPFANLGNTTRAYYLNVPTDTSVITSACPSAYQAAAKNGAYVVTKFSSPLLGYQFKPTSDGLVYNADNAIEPGTGWTPPFEQTAATAVLPTTAFMINTSDLSNLSGAQLFDSGASFGTNKPTYIITDGIIGENAFLTTGQFTPHVSAPSDMMVSVVVFKGLALNPNVGGTPSIRVKGRQHFECIANASNPSTTPFVHAPANYDMMALEKVIVAGKRMADAYPSSYNENGTILAPILSAVKGIAEPILKTVEKIPVLGDLAGLLGSIL